MEKMTHIIAVVLAAIPLMCVRAMQREGSSVQRFVQKVFSDAHVSDDVSRISSRNSLSAADLSAPLARVAARSYPSMERLFEGFEAAEADQGIVYKVLEDLPESKRPLNIDLRAWDHPPQNQGQEGSCTAFATVAVLENVLAQKGKRYKLSEWNFWYSYKMPSLKFAINTIKRREYRGIIADDVNGGGKYRVKVPDGYEPKYLSSVSDFVVALSNRKPFVIGIPVTKALEEPGPSGWIKPYVTESYGGHALAVVGYHIDLKTRSNSYFILRNSWGSDWGDQGYGYLPFDFCSLHSCYGFVIEKVSVSPSRS